MKRLSIDAAIRPGHDKPAQRIIDVGVVGPDFLRGGSLMTSWGLYIGELHGGCDWNESVNKSAAGVAIHGM